jgi:hypothetical protein
VPAEHPPQEDARICARRAICLLTCSPMKLGWGSVQRGSARGAFVVAAALGVACGSSSSGDGRSGNCPEGMIYCGSCGGGGGFCAPACPGVTCWPPTDAAPMSDGSPMSFDGPSLFTDGAGSTDGDTQDGPADAPEVDSSANCGTAFCGASQVCVQFLCGGGPNPCMPLDDAGGCPPGWRFDPTCPASTTGGCDPPPCSNPPPFCADIPAGCTGAPSCGCVGVAVCGSLLCVSVSGRDVSCGAA